MNANARLSPSVHECECELLLSPWRHSGQEQEQSSLSQFSAEAQHP